MGCGASAKGGDKHDSDYPDKPTPKTAPSAAPAPVAKPVEAEAESKARAEPTGQAESTAKAESEAGPEPKPKLEPDAVAEPKTVADPTAVAEPKATGEPKAAEPKAAAEPTVQADSKAAEGAPWERNDGKAPEGTVPSVIKDPDWIEECLRLHNELRAKHGAPPLKWSEKCAKSAELSCNAVACLPVVDGKVQMFDSYFGVKYGQNSTCGKLERRLLTAQTAVDGWYKEETNFTYGEKEPSMEKGVFGQFTQLCWKDSAYVGMARDTIEGTIIFANYWPAGNDSKSWETNVFPPDSAMQDRSELALKIIEAGDPYELTLWQSRVNYRGTVKDLDDQEIQFLESVFEAHSDAFISRFNDGWTLHVQYEPRVYGGGGRYCFTGVMGDQIWKLYSDSELSTSEPGVKADGSGTILSLSDESLPQSWLQTLDFHDPAAPCEGDAKQIHTMLLEGGFLTEEQLRGMGLNVE